jgi:hypothetical protein
MTAPAAVQQILFDALAGQSGGAGRASAGVEGARVGGCRAGEPMRDPRSMTASSYGWNTFHAGSSSATRSRSARSAHVI